MRFFVICLLLLTSIVVCGIVAAVVVIERGTIYEGKTVLWRGKKYIVIEKVPGNRVKIARKNLPHMMLIAKEADLRVKEWWE